MLRFVSLFADPARRGNIHGRHHRQHHGLYTINLAVMNFPPVSLVKTKTPVSLAKAMKLLGGWYSNPSRAGHDPACRCGDAGLSGHPAGPVIRARGDDAAMGTRCTSAITVGLAFPAHYQCPLRRPAEAVSEGDINVGITPLTTSRSLSSSARHCLASAPCRAASSAWCSAGACAALSWL